jgi:hypothetical protein
MRELLRFFKGASTETDELRSGYLLYGTRMKRGNEPRALDYKTIFICFHL